MRAPRVLIVLLTLLGGLLLAVPAPDGRAEPAGSDHRRVAFASVDAGLNFTCVVTTGADLQCWGHHANGQTGHPGADGEVGDGETPASLGFVDVGGKVASVSAGWYHACALLVTGRVSCWGYPGDGRLGHGTFTGEIGDDETPAAAGAVPLGGTTVTAVTAGREHTCALYASGQVRCWGSNAGHQLGNGLPASAVVGDDEPPTDEPVVDLGGPATAISAGADHTCALMVGGAVRCWGVAGSGRLGYGPQVVDATPTPAERGDVPLGGEAVAISAGSEHTCALMDTRSVRCWGLGADGRLGYGNTSTIGDNEPASAGGDVDLGGRAVGVAAARDHTCAALTTGDLHCWGRNTYGKLGISPVTNPSLGDDEEPDDVAPLTLDRAVVAVTTGDNHTCAVLGSDRLRCWGYGGYGQLGYGSEGDVDAADAADVPVGGAVRTRGVTRLTIKARTRDRRAPYVFVLNTRVHGDFRAPHDVGVCGGTVKVVVRARKGVVRRSRPLANTCATQLTVKVPKRLVGPRPARMRAKVTYGGNPSLRGAAGALRLRAG